MMGKVEVENKKMKLIKKVVEAEAIDDFNWDFVEFVARYGFDEALVRVVAKKLTIITFELIEADEEEAVGLFVSGVEDVIIYKTDSFKLAEQKIYNFLRRLIEWNEITEDSEFYFDSVRENEDWEDEEDDWDEDY